MQTTTIQHTKKNIAFVSTNTNIDRLSNLTTHGYTTEVITTITEEILKKQQFQTIIIDINTAATWEDYIETIKAIVAYENLPIVMLVAPETSLKICDDFLQKGAFGCVENLASSATLLMLQAAINQWEKRKESFIRYNELNRLLSTNYLALDAKNKFLEHSKTRIDHLIKDDVQFYKKELVKLSSAIEQNLKEEYKYQLFRVHFEEVHPLFYKALLAANDKLSNNDLKLAAFIKIGFNNAEISFFLGISIAGVKKGIQRMRKKLGLSREDSLRAYIFNIDM